MKKTVKAMILFIPVAFLLSCASMPGRQDSEITAEKNTAAKVIPINNQLPEGTLELIDGFEEENFWYALGETKSEDYSNLEIPIFTAESFFTLNFIVFI